VDEPHPHGVERGLEQQNRGGFECGNVPDGSREQEVREADLEDAEIED
jgi:hypothetical protein